MVEVNRSTTQPIITRALTIKIFLNSRTNHQLAVLHTDGSGPGIIFCGGFHSSMSGTKASFLEQKSIKQGWEFTRFDYRGHGASGGSPDQFTLHHWLEDTLQVIDWLGKEPKILVGSSMGGWIATLAVLARPLQVSGLVGIASAPDFTTELIWQALDTTTKQLINNGANYNFKSHYDKTHYPITKALLESGKQLSVLSRSLAVHCPVRLLHGSADTDVPESLSRRLLSKIESENASLQLLQHADHRFSNPGQLQLIYRTLLAVRHIVVDTEPSKH